MATIDELRALAREIREERQIGGNTGERVGNTFEKVADLLDSTGGDISDIREAVEQLLQDVGFIPRDISRTATDAVFTNSEGELLFWLRAATDTLAGLITAANNNKLIALPTAEELAQALAAKQNRLTFDPRPIEGSTNPVTSDGINTAIANFVTRSVSDLIYYYTKSETYTKEEVNALVAAIKQFVPVVAQTLPTPSADTMYKLYLIPSEDPQEGNIKDEYITIDNGASANPRYTWEKIGSVDIDISGKADIGTVPVDVTRTQTDVTFVNNNHDPLFYLRQATSSLAGLMTSAEHNKLGALPTAQDLNTRLEGTIYDISVLHPTSGVSGGNTYASLSAALAVIPQDKHKGGMTVRYIQSSDNKYIQARCMAQNFTTDVTQWQGVDEEPTAGSDNLVKSGGVYEEFSQLGQEVTKLESSSKVVDNILFVDDLTIYNIDGIVPYGTVLSTGLNILEHPDLEKPGILKEIDILNAIVTVAGTANVALFKKVKSGDVVTGFTKVTEIATVPIETGQTKIDLSHLSWVFDIDMCLGFFATNEQDWEIYDPARGYQLWIYNVTTGVVSKAASFPHIINNYEVVVSVPADYVLDETLESYVRQDDMGQYMKARSEHDIFPIYNVSGANYSNTAGLYGNRLMIMQNQNLQKSGTLKSFKLLSGSVQTVSTLKVALFRKVFTNEEVTGFTKVTEIVDITVPVGATEVDLSYLKWTFDFDMCLGFHITNESQFLKYDSLHGFQNWSYAWTTGTYYKETFRSLSYNVEVYVDNVTTENEFVFDDIPTEGSENFISSGSVYDALQQNITNDKVVVLLGDSITWMGGDGCNGRAGYEGRGWSQYFKEILKPSSIRSYARSGATWSHTANTVYDITEDTGSLSDDNVIYNQINRLIAAVSGGTQAVPDIIIIAAGTNDAWYPSARPDALSVDADTEFANTSGYITDVAVGTLTSIAAAMRYDIELIKTNFPNCQVIVTTPLQSTAFTLTKCFDVGKVISDCAKYLSIECVDQGAKAGIYRAQENEQYLFTYDGTHTSALGAKMVGQFLAHEIMCKYRGALT